MSNKLYNPLERANLGDSIAPAFDKAAPLPPAEVPPFHGAGIYAIYYKGKFFPYEKLAQTGHPIYIGKAVPKGSRKGDIQDTSPDSLALYNRLREHGDSIAAAKNLDLADFDCRYLVVDDIWIALGEAVLIQRHQPLWNQIVEGFGNHDPGSGRHSGKRPLWDEFHPGRTWAEKCRPAKLRRPEICQLIDDYMDKF